MKKYKIELEWQGEGVDEKGIVSVIKNKKLQILIEKIKKRNGLNNNFNFLISNLQTGKELVSVSPKYFRPTEVDLLIGSPTKAKTKLGWEAKTDINELIKIMVNSDIQSIFQKVPMVNQ